MSIFPTKILLATDGSTESSRAARMAVELSNKLGSELHVVRVGLMPGTYDPEFAVLDPEIRDTVRERAEHEARERIEEQVNEIEGAGGRISQAHARVGGPDVEIIGLAEKLRAGLVVLGSRGLGPLRRALLGSVSTSVVRHAHTSVLVVRGEGTETRERLPGRILLAIDGSEEATLAAHTAADIANKTGSELHAAYVEFLPPIADTYDDIRLSERIVESKRKRARQFLDEQVKQIEATGGTVAQAHVVMGRPDEEIVILGEELEVGLTVMGSRGLGGVRRALMGSVSDSVVSHARCPVLLVRKEEQG